MNNGRKILTISSMKFSFTNKIFKYPGMSAWYFIQVPKDISQKIIDKYKDKKIPRRGWGSVRVMVSIGKTSWETSIFPERKSQTYLLPLKKEVRLKEDMQSEDIIKVSLVLM